MRLLLVLLLVGCATGDYTVYRDCMREMSWGYKTVYVNGNVDPHTYCYAFNRAYKKAHGTPR